MKNWILVLLVAGSVAACKHGGKGGRRADDAVSVITQVVQSSPREVAEEVVGSVRTKVRSVIEAKVSGKISSMPVVLGQKVSAGDLLAQIDAQEIYARYEQAKAQREQALKDLDRMTALVQKQVSSRQEYDAAEAKFKVADATVREAMTMMGYAKVTAPFDGIVARKLADVGDLAAPGKPLLEIEDRGTLRFEADVPEALIGEVASGQKIRVAIPAIGKNFESVVVEVSPTADSASRTFLIKLEMPQDAQLRAGQFGRAAIPVGRAESIRVPASAVVQRGQMEVAFVVSDGVSKLRLVKTGKKSDGETEILSGLVPGDKVVLEGVAGLVDGQRVEAGK